MRKLSCYLATDFGAAAATTARFCAAEARMDVKSSGSDSSHEEGVLPSDMGAVSSDFVIGLDK